MREFQSFVGANWNHPDLEAYQRQKGITAINQGAESLWEDGIVSQAPPAPLGLLGNEAINMMWGEYYALRLVAARMGDSRPFLAFFPGRVVPGMGAGTQVREVGSLAMERFENLLSLQGALPCVGPFAKNHQLSHEQEVLPELSDWPWIHVQQPKLHVLHPYQNPHLGTASEKQQLKMWMEGELRTLLAKRQVREMLMLIHRCWSSHVHQLVWAPETVRAARNLFCWAAACQETFLATCLEVESMLFHIQHVWPLNVSSYGNYGGAWVEVGRLPIANIQCTELAVPARVLQELVNIRTKGFAPIVVNEFGCDTDGTHRLVASWLWNLLASLEGAKFPPDLPENQEKVANFVARNRKAMGEVVVREVLRALAHLLHQEDLRQELCQKVLVHIGDHYPVTHLPVLLLPEYSCGAVAKGPYDDGKASFRVDPAVYEILASENSLTLPARGPYHLTDRAPLPWFEILEER